MPPRHSSQHTDSRHPHPRQPHKQQPSNSTPKQAHSSGSKPNPSSGDKDNSNKTKKNVSMSKLKAAIRSATRFLSKPDLAADVRQKKEKDLAALQEQLSVAMGTHRERKNATRYHKVKFFERQKITRRLRQLQKQIVANGGSLASASPALQSEVEQYERMYLYVRYYPNSRKYVSLFKSEDKARLDMTFVDEVAESAKRRDEHGFLVLEKDRSREEAGSSGSDSEEGEDEEAGAAGEEADDFFA
jgi:hypothetical protein